MAENKNRLTSAYSAFITDMGMGNVGLSMLIERFMAHADRQINQIRRRVLNDEKIPHAEKVLSIFEEHTEWISKGKAGVPQELGLKVWILENHGLDRCRDHGLHGFKRYVRWLYYLATSKRLVRRYGKRRSNVSSGRIKAKAVYFWMHSRSV